MNDRPASADSDLDDLIALLLRHRDRDQVTALLSAFSAECAALGLSRTASRFGAGAALIAVNDDAGAA